MLVLTRKIGESLMIGDDITITVIEASGQKVRVGIDAPSAVPVYRKEVWLQIRDENAAAASADPALLESLMAQRPKDPNAD